MPSRYDYPDPGTDPAYCDGLAPDEPIADDADATMHSQPHCVECGCDLHDNVCPEGCAQPLAEYDGPACIYCGEPIDGLDDNEPFCSALCACYADLDNREDR